ncbi:MAG: phosphatidylserine/phosphatidylglycerophosphate/cardiolipin synthase family protein [Candidatus Sericytochromatia bacterium]
MRLIKKIPFYALSLLILASCSNISSNSVNLESDKIKSFSTDSASNLDNLNNAIDFSTNTKNTFNNSKVKLFIDTEAFKALTDMLSSAEKTIYVEIYEFANDKAGQAIAKILMDKAKQGVDVRFIYDFLTNTNVKLIQEMAKSGVKVQTYGKDVISGKGSVTHRKLYSVDGSKAMTGGMNIVEPFMTGKNHDVLIQYEGEIALATAKEFVNDWVVSGGKIDDKMKENLATPIQEYAEKYPLRLAITNPLAKPKKTELYNMFLAAIDTAKDNIKMAMPYFTDDNLIEHLRNAQRRGVKVTVIIPYKSFYKAVEMVNTLSVNQLYSSGVSIFRGGKDGTYNHSKVMTVDNVWTTIGSCNADARAFNNNQELNIAISDPAFTEEVNKRFFEKTIAESERGTYTELSLAKKAVYGLLEKLDRFF